MTWNHNTQYHRLLLRLMPTGRSAALDVGSGDGAFAALLARRFSEVVALDRDAAQVVAASARYRDRPNLLLRQGNFLESGLPTAHFDVVTALASFHHMPFADAVEEAVRVLKPGGRLLVLGVWTDDATRADVVLNVGSAAFNRILKARRGPDAMTAPATLERTSWREANAEAPKYLPGCRLRRRLLWRYTLIWDKPQNACRGSAP